MGKPSEPERAILIMGILYANDQILAQAVFRLIQTCGPLACNGPTIPFAFTKYYEEEMGVDLKKTFIAFTQPMKREMLAAIKQSTNKIENDLSKQGKRTVNIDPGYLTEHQFVLASAKEHPYRIYLDKGIYAQLILVYAKSGWISVEKTFADYQNKEVQEFLTNIRQSRLKPSTMKKQKYIIKE